MKFAIFGNTYQPKKSLHALRLFELLTNDVKKQGAEICMCREFLPVPDGRFKMEVPVDACSKATTSQPIWLSASEVTAHF